MIKLMGSIAEVLQKHGKIITISLIICVVTAWSVPTVRDSVLGVIGIGTHTQQIRTANKLADIETNQNKNTKVIDSIVDTLKDMRHFQLQSIITNDALPLELRLSAYDEYTALGYNSWTHEYYEKMLRPLTQDVMNYRFERIEILKGRQIK